MFQHKINFKFMFKHIIIIYCVCFLKKKDYVCLDNNILYSIISIINVLLLIKLLLY